MNKQIYEYEYRHAHRHTHPFVIKKGILPLNSGLSNTPESDRGRILSHGKIILGGSAALLGIIDGDLD